MVTLPKGPGRTSEVEWITSRWYWPYHVSVYVTAVSLTWMFVFAVYVFALQGLDVLAEHQISGMFSDPAESGFVFFGMGAVLASIVTPLFGLLYLDEQLETYIEDRGLVREVLGVQSIRQGRELMTGDGGGGPHPGATEEGGSRLNIGKGRV